MARAKKSTSSKPKPKAKSSSRPKAGVKPTGKLTGKRLRKVPSERFGIPPKKKGGKRLISTGKYPMPDKSHAANAKARAAQQLAKGNLSRKEYEAIVRKANKILYGKATTNPTPSKGKKGSKR